MGGRAHTGPCQARDHRGKIVSAVEAIFEFGEVARHMLCVDGAIGSNDCSFDVAERCLDPLERRRSSRIGSTTCQDDLMGTTSIGHAGETPQAITGYGTVGCLAGFDRRGARMAAKTSDPPQLRTHRIALDRGFDRGDERRIARHASWRRVVERMVYGAQSARRRSGRRCALLQ
jgi:hypothetical protein